MKTPARLLTLVLVSALVPTFVFAAKGERKKKDKDAAPAVSFSSADKDSDGVVTESEFAAAMKSQLGEDAAKLRFGTIDKNHDGKLSKDEYDTGASDSGEKKKRRKKNQ